MMNYNLKENAYLVTKSNKIARKWKIGDKDTNNGALLFISIDDKETRIETSDNLATRLTDAQSKQIWKI